MSAYTRKLEKERQRAIELEKSRAVLSRVFDGKEAVLDLWNPRQFLEFIRVARRVPWMNNDNIEYFVNSIRKDPVPFTLDDISERIGILTNQKRFSEYVTTGVINRVHESLSYWRPQKLLEYINFCQMSSDRRYIEAMMKMTRWAQEGCQSTRFRYEDIEAAMNMARVKYIMEM